MYPLLLIGLSCAPDLALREAWVTAPAADDRALLRELPVGFAEGTDGDRVRVHGTASELDRVRAAGLEVHEVLQAPPPPDTYATVDEVAGRTETWKLDHPDRVQRIDLGRSVDGRTIWGVLLGEPTAPLLHRVVAGLHGDEGASVELALALGDALLDEQPGFEGHLERASLWLVPLANPDGFASSVRLNRNAVDLNRNFSHMWSLNEYGAGPAPFSEPETRALRTRSLYAPSPTGISLHSGATNLGYVWNHTEDDTREEDRLVAFGEIYDTACEQPGFYLTNGAEWYTTRGDLNDWAYGLQGTLDFTLEASLEKSPGAEDLEQALAWHLDGFAAWLAVPVRLRGQLIDASTGRGLPGQVEVVDTTEPFLTGPQGQFARLLEPGAWTLAASAPGYADATWDLTLDDEELLVTLELEPLLLGTERPDPVLLSQGLGALELTVPILPPPDTLRLSRPGVDPLYVAFNGTGYPVNPDVLVPGPYSLEAEEVVLPRAIFVGAGDDRVTVASVRVEPDCIVLDGQGFAEGTEAWGIWGRDRALVPLVVLARRDGQLVLDRAGLPETGTVDVLLVSQGREVAVADVLGDPELDTAAPADSGWPTDTGEPDRRLGTRCSSSRVSGTGWALLLVLVALRTRRSS